MNDNFTTLNHFINYFTVLQNKPKALGFLGYFGLSV